MPDQWDVPPHLLTNTMLIDMIIKLLCNEIFFKSAERTSKMYNLIFSASVILILAILLFAGLKQDKNGEKAIILQRFNNIRGFFALEIIIGHVIRYDKSILYPLGKFMIISVAFFFFVSAFGLSYSFRTKDNYLKGFIKNRLRLFNSPAPQS